MTEHSLQPLSAQIGILTEANQDMVARLLRYTAAQGIGDLEVFWDSEMKAPAAGHAFSLKLNAYWAWYLEGRYREAGARCRVQARMKPPEAAAMPQRPSQLSLLIQPIRSDSQVRQQSGAEVAAQLYDAITAQPEPSAGLLREALAFRPAHRWQTLQSLADFILPHLATLQAGLAMAADLFDFLLDLQLHATCWHSYLRGWLEKQLTQAAWDVGYHLGLALFRRQYITPPDTAAWPDWARELWARRPSQSGITILAPPTSLRIAICVPTYNRQASLQAALKCIKAQTWQDYEVHIYDDASSDGTEAFCRAYAAENPNVFYTRHAQNVGFFGIQRSFRHMTDPSPCELFTVLADDDRWTPTHLEKEIELFVRYPWIVQSFASVLMLKDYRQPVGQFGPFLSQPGILDPQAALEDVLRIDTCPVGSVMRKRLLPEFAHLDLIGIRHLGEAHAAWDYMLYAKTLAAYEVGHVPLASMLFNISPETGSATWDDVADLLALYREVAQDYRRLYPEHCSFGNFRMPQPA